jgi:hypothetical protein
MGWVINATPRPLYLRERNSLPAVQVAGGPQGQSGHVRKISQPLGFDPRTFQPVVSRCADRGKNGYKFMHGCRYADLHKLRPDGQRFTKALLCRISAHRSWFSHSNSRRTGQCQAAPVITPTHYALQSAVCHLNATVIKSTSECGKTPYIEDG